MYKHAYKKESVSDIEHKYRSCTQHDAALAITNKHYIIGSVDQAGTFSVSASPVVHNTESQARAECARLAGQFPGKIYVMLKLSGGELYPLISKTSW